MSNMSPDSTLAQVQAEEGLIAAVWRVAVDEAYSARDAARRMGALQALSQDQVVEAYFAEHPAMKRWVERHIAAGTAAAGVHELEAELARTRATRTEQRQRDEEMLRAPLPPAPESMRDSWRAPFTSGPAVFPVLAEPPPPAPAPAGSTPTAATTGPTQEYSPAALGAWFMLRVATWPSGVPFPSEVKDLAAAEAVFGKISRLKFRPIRNAKTPKAWHKQGKRGGR